MKKTLIKDHHHLYLLILLVCTICSFSPALFNDFINWDDLSFLIDNPLIYAQPGSNVSQILQSHIDGRYYPLTVLIFQIWHGLFRLDPFFYHLLNLILHLLNISLLLAILSRLKIDYIVAFLTAAMFALHPVQVESVAWASSLKDVLFCFFYFSSILFYLNHRCQDSLVSFSLILSIICCALSLSAKSMAVSLPVTLCIIDYYLKKRIDLKDVILKLPYLFLAVFFGIITIHFADQGGAFPDSGSAGLIERMGLSIYALLIYVVKIFNIFYLSSVYPIPDDPGDVYLIFVFLSFPILLFSIILLGIIFLKKRAFPTFVLPILFFVISLFPVLHVIKVNTSIVYERFLYLPSIGAFLLISYGLKNVLAMAERKTRARRFIAQSFIVLIFIILGLTTWNRCLIWKDSVTFWSDAIKKFPNSPQPYMYRASAFVENRQLDRALQDIETAIKVAPKIGRAYFIRGGIWSQLGERDKAIMDYTQALSLHLPYTIDRVKVLNNRGNLYSERGELQLAVDDYNEALRLDPDNMYARLNRGIVFYKQHNYEAASEDFNNALKNKDIQFIEE